jgi:pyrroline-5-carboxylate reductase
LKKESTLLEGRQLSRVMSNLAVGSSDRTTFVAAAAGANGALRDEVLSLIEAHDRAGAFLESPVRVPDDRPVLDAISPHTHGKIVISFMAAISLSRLERHLPKAKVVRAMTNMAAMVGEAATAFASRPHLASDDLETARFLLGLLGEALELPESQIDAVTALSGSGPAYIAILIDALVTAGLKVGLPRDTAFRLATQTLVGTSKLLRETGMSITELRDAVTTPAAPQ